MSPLALRSRQLLPPPLAPLTGNLEPIAKAFTTSKSDPSSLLFEYYRKHGGVEKIGIKSLG